MLQKAGAEKLEAIQIFTAGSSFFAPANRKNAASRPFYKKRGNRAGVTKNI